MSKTRCRKDVCKWHRLCGENKIIDYLFWLLTQFVGKQKQSPPLTIISVKENCDCWKWSNSMLLLFLCEWSERKSERERECGVRITSVYISAVHVWQIDVFLFYLVFFSFLRLDMCRLGIISPSSTSFFSWNLCQRHLVAHQYYV